MGKPSNEDWESYMRWLEVNSDNATPEQKLERRMKHAEEGVGQITKEQAKSIRERRRMLFDALNFLDPLHKQNRIPKITLAGLLERMLNLVDERSVMEKKVLNYGDTIALHTSKALQELKDEGISD